MPKYTDQELITAFTGKPIAGQKRWEACFTPRGNAISQRDNDTIKTFSALNRIEAQQMATEYGMRILEARVRWIYMAK